MSISSQGFPIRALRGIRRAKRSFEPVHGALAALILLSLSGCHAMSSPQEAGMELAVKIDTSKPIRFSRHNFGAACYDTYGCRVHYAGRVRLNEPEDSKSPSPEEIGSDYLNYLSAGDIGIANFPPPADVTWRAADGTQLLARVDMAAIFADEIVLHTVPSDQLPPYLYAPVIPGVILVVNDRTVQVYMTAHITTQELQDRANSYSGFRKDMVLAHSKTY